MTQHHLILCKDQKLSLINFEGESLREWVLESYVRYMKVLGGYPKREALLLGLRNGDVLKLFIDNTFPMLLVKQNVPVRSMDINQKKTKVAVVDDNSTLSVYDLTTR